MSHVDILLPFGLPAPEIAADLLPTLNAPALSTLIAKAKAPSTQAFDPFARALPHETWLAGRLGLNTSATVDSSPPLAASRMRALHLQPEPTEGMWFAVQPVHVHIARDHLVLTDRRRTRLTERESRALFDTARPLFLEAGRNLQYGSADTWFARADDWRSLLTATPDAACGHNIDIWMPKGEGERAWRKLLNEVQMAWHEHAVNDARAAQRQQPVNSLWLWGGADASMNVPEKTGTYIDTLFAAGRIADTSAHSGPNELLAGLPAHDLLVLDDLSEAALAEEWASWRDHLHALDNAWFAPMLQALQDGRMRQIRLILGHNAELREFTVSGHSLRKFWIKPSLKRLLP